MIGKRHACTDFISVSGNRQEPETTSMPVNWMLETTLFWPWDQLSPSSHIHPTKNYSKTGMLYLRCLMGIGLLWFWLPEHSWELLGRVLTCTQRRVLELFNNIAVTGDWAAWCLSPDAVSFSCINLSWCSFVDSRCYYVLSLYLTIELKFCSQGFGGGKGRKWLQGRSQLFQ